MNDYLGILLFLLPIGLFAGLFYGLTGYGGSGDDFDKDVCKFAFKLSAIDFILIVLIIIFS